MEGGSRERGNRLSSQEEQLKFNSIEGDFFQIFLGLDANRLLLADRL